MIHNSAHVPFLSHMRDNLVKKVMVSTHTFTFTRFLADVDMDFTIRYFFDDSSLNLQPFGNRKSFS